MDTKKIIVIAALSAIVLVSAYLIFFPSVKPQKGGDTGGNGDGGSTDESKKYTPESFPLVKGMYGEDIRKVRAVFGLPPTDVFDKDLEDALYAKYGVKEITEAEYKQAAVWINPNV